MIISHCKDIKSQINNSVSDFRRRIKNKLSAVCSSYRIAFRNNSFLIKNSNISILNKIFYVLINWFEVIINAFFIDSICFSVLENRIMYKVISSCNNMNPFIFRNGFCSRLFSSSLNRSFRCRKIQFTVITDLTYFLISTGCATNRYSENGNK